MIIDLGTRAVSVGTDELTAAFTPQVTRTAQLTPIRVSSDARRAIVELRRFHGGLAPHALLGARFEPGDGDLVLRVGEGTAETTRRTCRVQLGRRKLFPGLPPDLAESVFAGLSRTAALGPGEIFVDRGGYDPVETSPLIVEVASELLGRILSRDPGDDSIREELQSWIEALP